MDALSGVVQNPAVTLLLIVLAVAGLILAYVSYRTRRVKQACWAIRSNNIVAGYTAKLGALQILYGGEGVKNVTISRLLFWNRGRETIDRGDIAPADPLRIIAAGEVKLLDVAILHANNEPSQFSATVASDRKSAVLCFEYLDPGQGAVLQVVHSGTSSKDVEVLGSIKGAGAPAKKVIRVHKASAPPDVKRI